SGYTLDTFSKRTTARANPLRHQSVARRKPTTLYYILGWRLSTPLTIGATSGRSPPAKAADGLRQSKDRPDDGIRTPARARPWRTGARGSGLAQHRTPRSPARRRPSAPCPQGARSTPRRRG